MGVFKPNRQNIKTGKLSVIQTTASIPTEFCTVIKTTKLPSWVIQSATQQIQNGGWPPY